MSKEVVKGPTRVLCVAGIVTQLKTPAHAGFAAHAVPAAAFQNKNAVVTWSHRKMGGLTGTW
jgi:hypothetical protein